jgi:uncharacterized membrane protein (UPF0127 family)
MNNREIKNITHPLGSPLQARYCQSFLCQFLGLMFTSRVEKQDGLLLVQASDSRINSSIHMFFVFTDLAVIWINSDLRVVDTTLAKSWRPFYIPHVPARYVLEINPMHLEEFSIGDQLEFMHE